MSSSLPLVVQLPTGEVKAAVIRPCLSGEELVLSLVGYGLIQINEGNCFELTEHGAARLRTQREAYYALDFLRRGIKAGWVQPLNGGRDIHPNSKKVWVNQTREGSAR